MLLKEISDLWSDEASVGDQAKIIYILTILIYLLDVSYSLLDQVETQKRFSTSAEIDDIRILLFLTAAEKIVDNCLYLIEFNLLVRASGRRITIDTISFVILRMLFFSIY